MEYLTLKEFKYEPGGYPENHKKFSPGDKLKFPGKDFPTELPIDWLLADKVIKKVK